MMLSPCSTLGRELPALFACSDHGEGRTRIRTPFLYPDGDVIDLFYFEQAGQITLTDYGETMRWLRMQTPALHRSPKQRHLIQDVCSTLGVEFFKGMLVLRLAAGEQLADAVIKLGQACVRVADVWFTMRTRAAQSTMGEVADFFAEKQIPFTQNDKLLGRSGSDWSVDFHTRTAKKSALIYVLSTGSSASSRRVADHVVAAWHDLNHLKAQNQLELVSLFDDTVDVWSGEDFRLLESLSTVARWSNPEELEYIVTGIAA